MYSFHRLICLAIVIVAPAAAAAELRIGAAAVDITPPNGIGMAGYYFERGAEGTHDKLYAKAIVMEVGGRRAALVALDLIGTTRSIVEESRRLIQNSCNIPGEAVMISATHAHTGPVLAGRSVRVEALGGAADLSARYTRDLPALIARAVEQAAGKLEPAQALVSAGREENLAFNRRFHMKDGTVGWNAGKNNPNILRPAGPTDPEIGVVFFESAQERGRAIAAYVNFAMHPDTVGGQLFSADYPGVLAQHMATWRGEGLVTLFANGCCGNVNHIDVKWAAPQKGPAEAHRIGTILAAGVMQATKGQRALESPELRIRSRMLKLPLPPVTPEQVAEARATVEKYGTKDNRGFMEKVVAGKVLDVAERKGQPHEVEVQVIALGDVAWVSMPGELFVELGLAIRKDSPFRQIFIAELANGAIGYIPDRNAYAEGNYEPVSARCSEGSGEMLVEAAVQILKELRGAQGE